MTEANSKDDSNPAALLADQARIFFIQPLPDLAATTNTLLQPRIAAFKSEAAERPEREHAAAQFVFGRSTGSP